MLLGLLSVPDSVAARVLGEREVAAEAVQDLIGRGS